MPNSSITCACPCGRSTFQFTGKPLVRFLCHCTICQALYRSPYADATVLWASQVGLTPEHHIKFKRYRPPPALRRGTCPACGLPVLSFLTPLAFIPSGNYPSDYKLPPVQAHIFYKSRAADVRDDLPKYGSYFPSQWAVIKLMVGAMLHKSQGV